MLIKLTSWLSNCLRRNNTIYQTQLRRAATSVTLNIAEGSTGQTDKEQSRFLGIALWSLIETLACIHLISKRNYCNSENEMKLLNKLYKDANLLAVRIQAMRNSLADLAKEETINYLDTGIDH